MKFDFEKAKKAFNEAKTAPGPETLLALYGEASWQTEERFARDCLEEIGRLRNGVQRIIDLNYMPKCKAQIERLGPDFVAEDDRDQDLYILIRGVIEIVDELQAVLDGEKNAV